MYANEKNMLSTVDLVTRDGLRITIRQNIWDARIVSEIFEKPYVNSCPHSPRLTVIDIGGYIGDFSLYATITLMRQSLSFRTN